MTICYFTATGNSLYVARRNGGDLRSIPQMMRNDDCIGCGICAKVCQAENMDVKTIPLVEHDYGFRTK